MDVYVGFDSAWTDNAKAPGAISAVGLDEQKVVQWHAPRLVSFAQALDFIHSIKPADGVTLIALDQPTIVPNATGLRPVERAAASVISWMGGGVQPSNTGKLGMFCPASPIWGFLQSLGAIEEPEVARKAATGVHVMEVFPALALASIAPHCFRRLGAPKYNPANSKKFKMADWQTVANVAAAEASAFRCEAMAQWCRESAELQKPRKADQDKLDSVLCTLIALRWRLAPRAESLMLGDLRTGYMVMPIAPDVRARLGVAAAKYGVPMA